MPDFGKIALSQLNGLSSVAYNVASLAKKPFVGNLTPIAFRDFNTAGQSNSYASGTSRCQVFPKFTSQDIVLAFSNFYNGGVGSPTPTPNTLTVKASIEINGKLIPVYFSGNRSITINPGGVVYSDPIPCIIGSTDTVYIRTYFNAGTNGYVPINTFLYASDGVQDGFTSGSDLTDSGTFSNSVYQQSYTASMMMGVTPTKRDAYLLLGDSIISGTGDSMQVSKAATGFVSRALTSKGLGWNKISMGGETVAGCLASLYIRRSFLNDHNKVIVNYPTNDMTSSSTLSTIQQNMLKLWQYLSSLGLTVYQTTISPLTSSTDYWTTLANQTVQGGNTETVRQGFNAWLRDTSANGAIAQSNGALSKVFDTASAVEATGGKWKIYNNGNPIFSGTVTSATNNTLTCSSMTFNPRDLDAGCVVKITGGTGAGQIATVNNNYSPATQIVVNSNWSTIPDPTSTFSIYKVATFDGTHPSPFAHIDMSANVNV